MKAIHRSEVDAGISSESRSCELSPRLCLLSRYPVKTTCRVRAGPSPD
jgi:hypothetical protein